MLMVMLSVCMCCAGAGLSDATELSGGSVHGPAAAGLCVLQRDLSQICDSHTLLSILR